MDLKFKRKIFVNSKTGQASIVLPKKMFKKFPKEAEIKIRAIKW